MSTVNLPISLRNVTGNIGSNDLYKSIVDLIYPLNSVIIKTTNDNPQTSFTWQTWVAVAGGRTLIGFNNDISIDTTANAQK